MVELADASVFTDINTAFATLKEASPSFRSEKVSARVERLKALRKWIHANRKAIQDAVYDDFSKPPLEVDVIEIFHVLSEIKLAINNIEDWAKPKNVDAPITMLGTRSWVQYEPRGTCLIMSPWNYPFSLAVGPLVSALAAGNNVIIKPSELTPNVSALIARMTTEVFDQKTVVAFEGGPEVAQHLLTVPFDHIFFTGSPSIGKVVMKAAAENLTSVTLELGGKSPSIITKSARIQEAAKRTAVAKFVNNGQTCVAPDYILVDESIAEKFTKALVDQTQKLFSEKGDFRASKSYCRIVNDRHFNRLHDLLQDAINLGAEMKLGGNNDPSSRFFSPVVLTNVPQQARILSEEIFGPIIPVVPYTNLDKAIEFINSKPKALALYIFSTDNTSQQKLIAETSSGGVCINESGIHFMHHNLPFGGVNNSGIGKSHGHYGFVAFSNEKPVLKQKRGFTTVQPFYPPYSNWSKKLVDWFLRFF